MIAGNVRLLQLLSERKVTLRLLQTSTGILEQQLLVVGNPVIDEGQIPYLKDAAVQICRELDKFAELLESEESTESIYSKSVDAADNIYEYAKILNHRIDAWHDENSAKIIAIHREKVTDKVLLHRSMCYQFTNLCRLAQAVVETNFAALELYQMSLMEKLSQTESTDCGGDND